MKATVFVGTSLDGFIARADGQLDFLHASNEGESYGYEEFLATVDTLGALERDIRLEHVATRTYGGGLMQSEYMVRDRGA